MGRFDEPDHAFQNRLRAAQGGYKVSWELVLPHIPDVYVVFIDYRPMAFVWREGDDNHTLGWNWLAPNRDSGDDSDVAADCIQAINNAVGDYKLATCELQAVHERRVAQDLAAARGEGAELPRESVLRFALWNAHSVRGSGEHVPDAMDQVDASKAMGPGLGALMASVAAGKALDTIGASAALLREPGETDDDFRARITARLQVADV